VHIDQTESVISAIEDAVATIRMTAPSLNTSAKDALLSAIREAAVQPSVRAIVLTGSGRVFSAGQDLAEHAQALEQAGVDPFDTIEMHYNPIIQALVTAPKPVVAAINGTCAGAGIGLALACDLRIAVDTAKFVTAFTSIGLTPDSGLSASLARAIGSARASELVMLPDPLTADEALRIGLIGRTVSGETFEQEVSSVAHRLAAGPTAAYAVAKRAIREAWTQPLDSALRQEGADQRELGATDDHRNAVTAFLGKQTPTFIGH